MSFHLRRIKLAQKHEKLPKYYRQDSLKKLLLNFKMFMMIHISEYNPIFAQSRNIYQPLCMHNLNKACEIVLIETAKFENFPQLFFCLCFSKMLGKGLEFIKNAKIYTSEGKWYKSCTKMCFYSQWWPKYLNKSKKKGSKIRQDLKTLRYVCNFDLLIY